MADTLDIPEALQMTFRRLIRRMPPELRNEQNLLESIIVYLKLGGERLARQRIDVAIEKHREEVKYMKRRLREEAMIKAAAMAETGAEGNDGEEAEEDDEYAVDDDYDESSDYYE